MNGKNGRMILAGAGLTLAVTLALLTGIIRLFACSPGSWLRELQTFTTPAATGLPEKEYPAMAEHIAAYLAGGLDSFQYTFSAPEGQAYLCFHEYELIHMADCRGLIRLDGWVLLASLLGALALGGWIWKNRKASMGAARQGARVTLWGLSLVAAALVLWAVIDFEGLFVTFHRAAFRNDFWLLDPRTDLLIRLMPETLFVDLGLKGLGLFVAGGAMILLMVKWIQYRRF